MHIYSLQHNPAEVLHLHVTAPPPPGRQSSSMFTAIPSLSHVTDQVTFTYYSHSLLCKGPPKVWHAGTRRCRRPPRVRPAPAAAWRLRAHIVPHWQRARGCPRESQRDDRHQIAPYLSVLGFWDNNTGICAGAMPYRRDLPATTRI